MTTPPRLDRGPGISQLADLHRDTVNVRLPLFDPAERAAVARLAADVLPQAGVRRSREERDAPGVNLLGIPVGVGHPAEVPSFSRIHAAALAVPGLLPGGAPPYRGPVDASSPIRAPRGLGPHGTPMTISREAVDIVNPMRPGPVQVIQVIQPAEAPMPVTPPRGADGRIHAEVPYVINRTVPNPELM
jgi:hypothetical protein